jgi:hypothetical protein
MKFKVPVYLISILIGYIVSVIFGLFMTRSVIRQNDVFDRYCADGVNYCACERKVYGLYESGLPFVSSRSVQLPCGKEATTEEYSIMDFDREEPLGFYANIFFWSLSFLFCYHFLKMFKNRDSK